MPNRFNNIIKSIIKASGGSLRGGDLEKFTESINHSFIFDPYNHWLGVRILKNPLDLMVLQDIMFEKRPDTIIECGTMFGGSAYFMACLMDLMNIDGKIITIDNQAHPIQINGKIKIIVINSDAYHAPVHPKIKFIHSDCLTAQLPELGDKVMVVLDCDHSAEHVYAELEKFSGMVTLGQYIIVEDTDAPDKSNGPAAAVEEFLRKNKNFKIDKNREKYGISSNPGGYLLKIS